MNKSVPLVSIIIPCFNAEKFVEKTIISALNQSWKNIEVIVVDDGSKDATIKIIEKINDNRIKIYKQNHKGASVARNYGLKKSTGDYIQYLDSDDILENDKIYNQLKRINFNSGNKVLLSSSWYIFYNDIINAKLIKTPVCNSLQPREFLIYYLKYGYYLPNCSWLVHREIIESSGLWNYKLSYNDDGEYFMRVILNSDFIEYVADSKCYYRKGNTNSLSFSRNLDNQSLESWYNSMIIIIENVLQKYKDSEMEVASLFALERILRNPIRFDLHYYNTAYKYFIALGGTDFKLKEVKTKNLLKTTLLKIIESRILKNLHLKYYLIKVKIIKLFDLIIVYIKKLLK